MQGIHEKIIYYLPGYGGLLATGLGAGLLARGLDVTGRQTVDEFKALPFHEQVDLVAQDLQDHFWHADARVVANSFGAYLFLHAQAQLLPFPGRVLLLSPIVGEFSNEDSQMNFIPPRVERLQALVKAGHYPTLARCEVHVGEQDWQSNPANVAAFGKQLGLAVTVVPQAGHMLGKSYVSALLDRWL